MPLALCQVSSPGKECGVRTRLLLHSQVRRRGPRTRGDVDRPSFQLGQDGGDFAVELDRLSSSVCQWVVPRGIDVAMWTDTIDQASITPSPADSPVDETVQLAALALDRWSDMRLVSALVGDYIPCLRRSKGPKEYNCRVSFGCNALSLEASPQLDFYSLQVESHEQRPRLWVVLEHDAQIYRLWTLSLRSSSGHVGGLRGEKKGRWGKRARDFLRRSMTSRSEGDMGLQVVLGLGDYPCTTWTLALQRNSDC